MNFSTHFTPAAPTGLITLTASAVLAIILSGCGDNRESQDTAQQPSTERQNPSPQASGDSGTQHQTVERYSEQVQEPERDYSINDDAAVAAEMAQFGMVEEAIAEIAATEGNTVNGSVRFGPTDDKRAMLVSVEMSGLKPGLHGFHIHANGDCSSPDASSAGGPFNPYNTDHGSPDADKHHLGDLGNIKANQDGQVIVEIRAEDLAFSGPASILQKAVVVHAKADDLETNPSGNSGKRLGCGVIRQEPQVLAD